MAGALDGRVAIITGSGRGQGLAAARRFSGEGALVVVTDLDQQSVTEAVKEIEATGGTAFGQVGDVSSSSDVQRVLQATKAEFGGVDIIFNNAGIGYSAQQRLGIAMDDIVSCTEEDWRRILDINLGGVFLFCKYGIPLLVERGGGVVINTASITALRGAPNAHAYTASKGAILSLTRAIAATYGHQGIRANTICPGLIDTEMVHDTIADESVRSYVKKHTPVGRIGLPDDIAELALFLASDASGYITGQVLICDGGATAAG